MNLNSPRRPAKWTLWILPLIVLLVAAKKLNTSPPTSESQTTPDHEEEALRSRLYDAPWSQVVESAQKVLHEQRTYGRAWKIGQTSIAGVGAQTHLVQKLRAQVLVLLFIDDLEVTLYEENENRVRVDVKSKSRLGRGDFGENRRHVLQFLTALDADLAQ
ncbi:MAG TPA: DUF1499 domain-containing protein [Abditibacterium sp.]|jgi:hypothetical protein